MECYDTDSITEIVEYLGQVLLVAFDPLKPQIKGYIRVGVLFNVSKPLRNSKEYELQSGGFVIIGFEYERIRKRCFQCQMMTHDKKRCPSNPLNRKLIAMGGLKDIPGICIPKISKDDPLFGNLTDDDVGIDDVTGCSKIVNDVLNEMRSYLSVQDRQ